MQEAKEEEGGEEAKNEDEVNDIHGGLPYSRAPGDPICGVSVSSSFPPFLSIQLPLLLFSLFLSLSLSVSTWSHLAHLFRLASMQVFPVLCHGVLVGNVRITRK